MTNGYGANKEKATTKISGDMLSLCYNKVTDDVVKSVKKSYIIFNNFE